MKVLLLSPYPEGLMPALVSDDATVFTGPPSEWPSADFIVSYGYRHIIREPQLSLYAGRLVNVHISLLPWNRGSDPNLWSWFDDTPKGVSIHAIDSGIDTGPNIAQQRLELGNDETLSSSYFKLRSAAERLFCTIWPIRAVLSNERIEGGSLHRSRDKTGWFSLLSRGYDTPVAEVVALGRRMRARTSAGSERRSTVPPSDRCSHRRRNPPDLETDTQ